MIFNFHNLIKSSTSFNLMEKSQIKVLLLENVHVTAVEILKKEGYQIEHHTKALPEDELKLKLSQGVHVVGIRSKTKLTKEVLEVAKDLLVIGCFCIGTNQVNLSYASERGISVFNSPFSNSRSVAEMVLAEIIFLSRQLGDRNTEVHQGIWNKVSKRCYEVRGKKLGIVGYGHIGSQLSVLAEALGMQVYFYDILPLMPLGSAKSVASFEQLLALADYVTFHVPETEETKNLVGEAQLNIMKQGSYLINASRGTVVQIGPLANALRSGHLAGAAVDVYPSEPSSNGTGFQSELLGCPNTILSPHIGGSTEEAQSMIGVEVGNCIATYLNLGSSQGSVNLPQVNFKVDITSQAVRVLFAHHNVPGVLKNVNNLLADYNVERQTSESKGKVAYLIADILLQHNSSDDGDEASLVSRIQNLYKGLVAIDHSIWTRILL